MMMSILKQGIITTSEFSEIPINPYDTTIYTEPDGSTWIRIFHHNNPSSNLFSNSDDFENFIYKNENMWLATPLLYFVVNDMWELMVKQKTTSSSAESKWRWIQTKNPYEATYSDVTAANIELNTSSEYSSSTYGGLYKGTVGKSYFNINSDVNTRWYGAVGSWTAYQGGIPGYPLMTVTSGYIDLYMRINTTVSIYENGISANEFYEI